MDFTINGVDFSPYVDQKAYNVIQEFLYESWLDGNGTEHRTVYRTKVSGTIKLEFFNTADYGELLGVLNDAGGAYVECLLPVNNISSQSELYNLFIVMSPEFIKDRLGNVIKTVATLKVVQR